MEATLEAPTMTLELEPKRHPAPAAHPQQPLAIQTAPGPMAAAMEALRSGLSLEQLQGLLALQKDYEANEARKAYVDAVAAFKLNSPAVYKDKTNVQFKSRYTSIGNMVNTVNAALSQHGLSANWTIDQRDEITVTCTLTHRLGHSDSCTMSGPPDGSGAKNPLQQIKSTVTYLKLATYEAITGIASSEGNADDDGNGSNCEQQYDPVGTLKGWIIKVDSASNQDALNKVRRGAGTEFTAAKDWAGWDAFKLRAEQKRKSLAQKGL